ncbi:hypothetical protein ACIB24_06080 [Spongisporangium articulatum]|uniref:Lipoprotein n=1 Tax=Spongisporangium articulatum TaxID=3362603 RepID=A0ABW8AKV4_9ACTN
MKRSRSAARLAGPTAVVAVGVLGLAGCASLNSPATIRTPYAAADGTTVKLPDTSLTLSNFLVVGTAKDQPAEVVGAVINGGDQQVQLSLTADPGSTAQPGETVVVVPAHGIARIGPDQDTSMPLPQLAEVPGAEMTLSAATTATGATDLVVPIVRPTLYYAGLTASPEPSVTRKPRASATTSPSGAPSASAEASATTAP